MVGETRRRPVEALARAAGEIAAASDLRVALEAVARHCADALQADLVVVRVADRSGALVARAVAPAGSALAAEVALTHGPDPTRLVAARAGADVVAAAPARWRGRVVGLVEVVRASGELSAEDQAILDLTAGLLGLAVRMTGGESRPTATGGHFRRLEVTGAALAVGGDPDRAARHALEVAVDATQATAGALWRLEADGPKLAVSVGGGPAELPAGATEQVVTVERHEGLPGGSPVAVTVRAGRPPQLALQLFYAEERAPSEAELPGLVAFAARAAHAVLTGERAIDTAAERDRARSLLEVVAASITRLSLTHVLATAVDRVGDLLPVDRIGVYLRDGNGQLSLAAGRGLTEGHASLAEDVLELALGPLRARDVVRIDVPGGTRAVGVPLRVGDEPIGLLVTYPRARDLSAGDIGLLTSLAAQLAVAVQNARLHERATELGEALTASLASEREASERVRALYEISKAAQSLSLAATLRAVAETTARMLGAGAAVLRLRDGRGAVIVDRATYVEDSRLERALGPILELPDLSPEHHTLTPFLDKGATAARLEIPVAPNVAADVVVVSLDPARPLGAEAVAAAGSFLQQAGLVIDNARLHEQQKQFAETMQRSLLPRHRPSIPGLDVGAVYESAAYVDVGGDVFDFLELEDGRLAVALGDVTGHGVAAAADMALAKFVFRSLAREHPEPAEFLRYANDVVVGEVELGAFVTMVYVAASGDGRVECACAGHPRPRLVVQDGPVQVLDCEGLALGIEGGQVYGQAAARLAVGGALVLYTDGVVEARRENELFGTERLDAVLRAEIGGTAQAIADAVVSACRAFAGGELADDCAIVILKKV